MTEIHKFQASEAIDVLDLGDFIMGEIDDLQIEYCGDVSRYDADFVMAEVELADALGRAEVGNFLDFNALRLASWFLPHEVIQHC